MQPPSTPSTPQSREDRDYLLVERLLELQAQKQELSRRGDLQGVSNLAKLIRDLTHQLES